MKHVEKIYMAMAIGAALIIMIGFLQWLTGWHVLPSSTIN